MRFTGIHEQRYLWPESGNKSEDTPERFGSIWVDRNGDGQMDPLEFTAGPPTWMWGRYVDSRNGDIWSVSGSSILRMRAKGLSENGVPLYTHSEFIRYPLPKPFTDVRRAVYDGQTDSLYLMGTTLDLPRVNQFRDDRSPGRALARYDNWSDAPVLRWVVPVSNSDGGFVQPGPQHREAGTVELPQGLAHAGGHLFVGSVNPPHIHALSKETGKHQQTFQPGPEVGGVAGWLDIPMPFNAHRRADGEYFIFVEEGARHKVLLYRWRP